MPEIHFLPVADSIIRSQGMVFAKPNRSVLEQAIAWADVVHFMMPFALSRVGLRIAKEMGKPPRTDRCSVISLIELINYQQDFHILLHSADFSKACPLTFFRSFHSFLRTLFAHAEFVSSARRHKSRD